MILTIDIGNSRVKCSLFTTEGIHQHTTSFEHKYWDLLLAYPYSFKGIQSAILSDVNGVSDHWILNFPFPLIKLDFNTPTPLRNLYKTPETLGMDRLANVMGAQLLFPESNVLVIDIGTCITFDMLNENSIYEGGSISPGTLLRFKALHTFTGKLPLVNFAKQKDVSLVGKNTNEYILSGVILGTQLEIEARIMEYKKRNKDLKIIVCGGGRNDFVFNPNLKIFAYPNLLAKGLYNILKYNELH